MSCHANELKTRAREEAARAKESRERMDRLVVEQRLEEEEEATDHTAQKERERNQDAARKKQEDVAATNQNLNKNTTNGDWPSNKG